MNLPHSSTRKFRDDRPAAGPKSKAHFGMVLFIAIAGLCCASAQGQTLGVDDLIRLALERNQGLQADRAQLKAAEGRLRQAGLKANPMLETSALTGLNDRGMQAGSVLLSVPLEANGRRARRIELAERELERLRHEIADRERVMAGEVRTRYSELIEAQRTGDIYQRLLVNNRHNLEIIRARVAEGATAALEQGQLEAEVLKLEAQRYTAQTRIAVLLENLREVIGPGSTAGADKEPRQVGIEELRDEFESQRPLPEKQEAIDAALRQRQDLAAASAGELVAEAALAQARTEGRFDLSVFTEFGFQRLQFDPLGYSRDMGAFESIGMRTAMVKGGVTVTLPTRNRNEGNIDAALAMREEAHLRRRFVENVIRRQVGAAYERAAGAAKVLTTYNGKLIETSDSNLKILRTSFELGYVRMSEVLAEQRRALDVQMSRVAALKELFSARMELETQTGNAVRK